ncbi:MAG: hypothetical protein KBE22_11590 [Candidatus Accumulibacter sp.]|nr:hypothetical protein [Accumulibacter sp.]
MRKTQASGEIISFAVRRSAKYGDNHKKSEAFLGPSQANGEKKMDAGIPVLGAGFTILFMVACLSSPAIGLIIDWFARHRQHGRHALH